MNNKKIFKVLAIMLIMGVVVCSNFVPVSATKNNFTLSASKSGKLNGYTIKSSFKTNVTGGASSPVRYRARFKGSATGKWSNTRKCKIDRVTSFKTTGIGSISVSKSPSISISNGTCSYAQTYNNNKFTHNYDIDIKRINICWVTQLLETEYTYGNVSSTINCSKDRVFW